MQFHDNLSLVKASVGYGKRTVLCDVSVTFPVGKISLVAGANGSGKSTLLKSLYRLLPLLQGQLRLGDIDVTHVQTSDLLGYGVVYVAQNRNLFGSLSVTENLRLRISPTVTRKPFDERIDELEAIFPTLTPLLHRSGGVLSGGERQLVSICAGVLAEPRILILDEPLIGVSTAIRGALVSLFGRLSESKGLSVIIAEQGRADILASAHMLYVVRHSEGVTTFERKEAKWDDRTMREALSQLGGFERGEL